MAKNDYREIAVLRDPEGVIAVVTKRGDTDYLSFAIQKEFPRRDDTGSESVVRTSFLNRRHIVSVRRLLDQLESFLDQEIDKATARRSSAR